MNAYVIRKAPKSAPSRPAVASGTELHHLLQALIDHDQYLSAIERMASTAERRRRS
jgi:hypothetical protein